MFETTTTSATKTTKIFLVDVSSVLRTRLKETISEIGDAEIVGEADSALDAIEEIRKTKPEVVVLDIRLRAGTGLDVLQEIKRDINTPMTVIVMTNYPYEQYRRLTLSLGADHFFHKATQYAEMVSVLKGTQPCKARQTSRVFGNLRECSTLHGNETVLVVEDEEMLRELLSSVLGNLGYRVITAVDGQEALEVFKASAGEIDVVVTDMGLPKQSGLEVFLKMKSWKPGVNVILVSGYLEPDTRASLLRAGVKMVLEKPFHGEHVANAIRQILNKASQKVTSVASAGS